MAVHGHTNGHLLQIRMKLEITVHVKVVRVPQFFVGTNYYCESGYNGTSNPSSVLYSSDPLWDGSQCESEGSCCSTAPWFTVDLVNSTSDDIEVRICADYYEHEEDTPIHLLELYIQ